MEIQYGIRPSCSEWDEQVSSDDYKENYSEKNYPEIEEVIKKVIKEKGWDE
jgi:hypothetical protein